MEVNRLSEDELKYELTIRGYPLVADINIMRDLLRSSLRTNENHLETYVLLDAKDEIFICTAKLRELKETIDNMDGDQSSESFKTVDTKLNHLLARIERITTEDPSLKKQRSILLKTILHLMQESSSKTQNTIVNPTKISIEQYNITPVTRTWIAANKMSTSSSPIAPIMAKKDEDVGIELFTHQGVALKKKNMEQKVETIPGTLSISQYANGKYIEWKPFDPAFESENVGTDCEWDVVDAVRRRTTSTSSNVESSQLPQIRIAMKDFRTYKIKQSRQISIRTANDTRYSFLFQSSNSDGFINSIRAILKTQRAGRSKTTYIVLGERDESRSMKSFNDLKIFPDHSEPHNVWNFMRNLQTRPYETTLETFSKLTDTLLYRTPEHRPMDAEVAELLTKSLHVDDGDKNLESDFAIIGDIENIVLAPRIAVKRGEPLTYERWAMSLDSEGRVKNPEEVKHIIFKGGVEPSLRNTLWKYLLNFYPWTSSSDECYELYKKKIEEYCVMKRQWQTMTPGQEMRFSSYRERKNLIEKDVNRTDRTLAYYAGDDNKNLRSLNDILMTYVMYNFDLGYVQGMSDLLSPILHLLDHEMDAFWCFVGFMDRVAHNFDLDQAGMKKQLSELYAILKVTVPDLADYLKKHESSNMFFCFRGLLVHFKREFSLDDIMRLWEVVWTDIPCPNFHLLICAAILDMEKKKLMMEGNGFTEILKHVNELSCKMDLNKVLAEAESMYEQLKDSGDNVPVNVRRIVGLAVPQENESDVSEEESYVNTTYPATPSLKTSDDNDSFTDDLEKVTFGPCPGEIGFEGVERAMSLNYY